MNSGKNIMTAFNVVFQTYSNLKKMFEELDEIAERNNATNIISHKSGFLRERSEIEPKGWYLRSFIKLYQKKNGESISDSLLINEPIYAMEISFHDSSFDDSPEVVLAKLNYKDDTFQGKDPNISEHWKFYRPLHVNQNFTERKVGDITITKPINTDISGKYGNIKEARYKKVKLVDIKPDNIENIFQELLAL